MHVHLRKPTLVVQRREDTLELDQAAEIQFALHSVREADVDPKASKRSKTSFDIGYLSSMGDSIAMMMPKNRPRQGKSRTSRSNGLRA